MTRPLPEVVQHSAYVAGAEDDHGNPTEEWADPVDVRIYGLDPGSSSEPREGGDRVIVEPAVYFPDGVVFGPRDRVTSRGNVYEVEGETREWRHPSGLFRGNVATLRRVDG